MRASRLPLPMRCGLGIIGLLAVVAILAPLISPYDPYAIDPALVFAPPSSAHWAGTDALGRDVFSRILWGARPSLLVAFGIVLIGSIPGTIIGAASALEGGVVDKIIMRSIEILMALPGLVVALALAAALGPSLLNLTLALGLLSIPFYARIVRGQVLGLRESGYVRAARATGASRRRILAWHILPNVAPMVATFSSLGLSGAILAASAFSFVGLGAQPPTAEWGALIFDGRETLTSSWWISVFPGLAVFLSAIGFNLLGDGLRDWFDPKAQR